MPCGNLLVTRGLAGNHLRYWPYGRGGGPAEIIMKFMIQGVRQFEASTVRQLDRDSSGHGAASRAACRGQSRCRTQAAGRGCDSAWRLSRWQELLSWHGVISGCVVPRSGPSCQCTGPHG